MGNFVTPRTQKPKADYFLSGATKDIIIKPKLESDTYKAANKLAGKTAFITGGDSGIGAAVAIAYAKEGANVAIAYYESKQDAEDIVKIIEGLGRKAMMFGGDIGDETYVDKTINTIVNKWQKLDILVNNAAEQTLCNSILKLKQEQLVRTFQTNIFGMFYTVKAALPHMPKGGVIINTSSITAYLGSKNLIDYAATKGAVVSFTRSLATNDDIIQRGIRVNGVAPGPIWTPLVSASLGATPELLEQFGTKTPLGRAGHAYELAPAYVYLACNDSSYVTGQIMHINGGEIVAG